MLANDKHASFFDPSVSGNGKKKFYIVNRLFSVPKQKKKNFLSLAEEEKEET
jgi:hypothetical protein